MAGSGDDLVIYFFVIFFCVISFSDKLPSALSLNIKKKQICGSNSDKHYNCRLTMELKKGFYIDLFVQEDISFYKKTWPQFDDLTYCCATIFLMILHLKKL